MTNLSLSQTQPMAGAFLPDAARHYLAHTTEGRGIREIARDAGCHASTVLRQVRKTEAMRDDPLVDRALSSAEDAGEATFCADAVLDAAIIAVRHLCQPGAMLLFNADLPQPAIVQSTGEGATQVLSTATIGLSAALIMRGWLAEDGGTALRRYRITPDGRSALPGLIATRDRRASADMDHALDGFADTNPDRRSRDRATSNGPGSESPLVSLSRRRGSDGQPFLTPDFVSAGDRLFEDYQIAGFHQTDLLGWDSPAALTPFYDRARGQSDTRKAEAAIRTLDAISDLGPGLSDVVLRCCCLREGLEATEKRLGWSARSGKVVLRIALQRLSLFYAATLSEEGVLIG